MISKPQEQTKRKKQRAQ
ncbi:hypothetical protein U0070_012647, partial [Myodes glareolus]